MSNTYRLGGTDGNTKTGNYGIGATPAAWGASHSALQVGARSSLYFQASQTWTVLGHNTYDTGANNPTAIAAAVGARVVLAASGLSFQTAASVGAGSAQTFTERLLLEFNGDVLVPSSGASGMTDGFVYIPAAGGAATGTPTNRASNRVPLYYDVTNHRLYAHENGVGWKSVLFA